MMLGLGPQGCIEIAMACHISEEFLAFDDVDGAHASVVDEYSTVRVRVLVACTARHQGSGREYAGLRTVTLHSAELVGQRRYCQGRSTTVRLDFKAQQRKGCGTLREQADWSGAAKPWSRNGDRR